MGVYARAECKGGEERTTTTGSVFTCDISRPQLGEAWRDRNGLIWGDIVKTPDGSVYGAYHDEATNYCASIGARLPSKVEFTRLREYMGAQPGTSEGFSSQILPNLSDQFFWSSSVYPNYFYYAHVFSGFSGSIGLAGRDNWKFAVRCVASCCR